jgi:hypothetical protein
MNFSKSKSTARFNYTISRNDTAKKAGSNIVTIATNPIGEGYSVGTSSLTMSVREAKSLQTFLNQNLSDNS